MIRHGAAVLCMVLAACAHSPVEVPEELFADERFASPSQRISAEDVFALSAAMQRYVQVELDGGAPFATRGLHQRLIDALYTKSRLKLDYEAARTRNAAEAFEARSGNCLSLVIMTAAFAKALGLPVEYHSAFVEPMWSRSGGMHFLSGHVNVVLGGRSSGARTIYDSRELLVVDFLPREELRGLRSWAIPERTVVAMYMNNRAAESLAVRAVDEAYWWARAAIRSDPAFAAAYNTLGVVYLRHGDWPLAERVLHHALEREPGNPHALSNLALALQKAGRTKESADLRERLARIEPYPPFHFLDRGLAALRSGHVAAGKDLLEQELERLPYDPEVHFWLAVANLRLGKGAEARRHLALAAQNSVTREQRELYAGKLEQLRLRQRD